MKIGIPRGLLYYWYGHLWEEFWQECGCETVVSASTDHQIMLSGIKVALDELCLPMKIFIGHIKWLAPVTDLIMIPHLIKIEKDAYICPKFMGLPDLVRHTLPALRNQFLVVKVGPKNIDMIQCLRSAASRKGIKTPSKNNLVDSSKQTGNSPALTICNTYRNSLPGNESTLTIGLLGHPYCLYDAGFNLNFLQILTENQINFLTPEMIPPEFQGVGSGKLNKKMFWTLGRSQLDSLDWMLRDSGVKVDGFIHLTPFACGLEAIIGDMMERRIKAAGKPFLRLNLEEHSGEAGIITRLEAFISLLQYRERVPKKVPC